MRYSRHSLILLVLLAICVAAGVPLVAQRDEPRAKALKNGLPPYPSQADVGRWTVFYFPPDDINDTVLKYLAELQRQSPALAGVRQVVMLSGPDNEAIRARFAKFEETKGIYFDPNGFFAKKLEVEKLPTIVVVSPEGEAVYRHTPKEGAAMLPFRSIAAQVERRWQDPRLSSMHLVDGVALGGYDPVAYFTDGTPKKGKPSLRSNYRGAVYYFSSEENQAQFAEAPDKYLPEFGGWDATAMADGQRVAPDPNNFRIIEGKLYLFYNGIWGDSQANWTKNEESLLRTARQKWAEDL